MTRCQMTSYLVLAVWAVQSSAEVSLVYHDYGVMPCNTSRDGVDVGSIPIQILGPRVRQNLIGKPYFCQYEFVAPENHYVSAEIVSVVTGSTSYNFTEETCGKRNFLRVWDGLRTSEWKPTEVCGKYQDGDISVKRIVSGREMKVEFRTQDFTEQTKYDVRITFHETEISHARIETHYGAYGDVHGRVSKTLCDWEIEVNKCIGHCQLTTPGYPGIYPPHTMCNYRLVNRDGERVELYLSGTSRDKGKFDLKRTEECSEDKLVVYDGYDKDAPIIGIFCGHQTVPEIISTGSALFMELHTLAGSPPWDYSGFDARVGHRFPSDFRTGQPMVGKPCSWEFNSTLERFGTIHTPDYRVLDKIECEYHFFGAADEYVEFEISITALEPRREFIFIYGGSSTLPEKIWSDDLTPQRRQEKMINSSTHNPAIIYSLEGGQMSNAEPVFIYYSFKKRATVAPPVVVNDPKPSSKSGAQKLYPVLTVIVLTVLIVMIKLSEVA